MIRSPATRHVIVTALATLSGGYALFGGLVSLLGWLLDIPRLTDWFDDGVSIQGNACALVALSGAGLVLVQRRLWWPVVTLGAVVGLAGLLILLQHIVGADFGFNHQLLFGRTWGQGTTVTPGRVGPPASTSFTLIGVAFVLLARAGLQSNDANARRLVPTLGLAICVIMAFSLLGYLFGAKDFYTIPWLTAIALPTSTMIFALGLGLVLSVPDQQPMLLLQERSGSGALARIAIPALVVIIPMIHWLRYQGYNWGYYDLGTGRALDTLTLVLATVAILWISLMALRRHEHALRDREERYELVVAGAEAAIWDWDVPGGHVVFSPRWKQLRGLADDEVTDSQEEWHKRIHPDDVQNVMAAVAAHFAGQTPVFAEEYRVRHKDGRWIWILDRGIAKRDAEGRVVRMAGSETDITERKHAEQALRQSEARFSQFMEHLPGLAWIKDLQGRYVFVNDAAQVAFQAPREQLYGKSDADIFPQEIAAQFQENDRRAAASGKGVQVIETLRHPDGVLHYSVASKFPIPGRDGQATLVGGMAIDITDRMRAENALRDADRRKDEFLATLAHELRNPLAPIRSGLEIAKDADASSDQLQQAQSIMERQLDHLVRLVDDLLDISRITCDKLVLHKAPAELAPIAHQAVDACRSTIEEGGHELTVDLPPTPVYIDADAVRLNQVFINLLNNACKYSDRPGRIRLSAERLENDVIVRVQDSGIGIAPDMLSQVFGMFEQADRSLERTRGGLGVGLTLAKRLVEMHGGSIHARSAGLGHGSEFLVRLPILQEAQQQETRRAGASLTTAHRILIVDDNRDAAISLAMLLRIAGNETCTAHDGLEAIETAKRIRPDAILLDIGLPNLNGYDVCRNIREQLSDKRVVIIALTGWGQDEDRRKSREAGFDAHLVKPIKHEVLLELLGSFDTELRIPSCLERPNS